MDIFGTNILQLCSKQTGFPWCDGRGSFIPSSPFLLGAVAGGEESCIYRAPNYHLNLGTLHMLFQDTHTQVHHFINFGMEESSL